MLSAPSFHAVEVLVTLFLPGGLLHRNMGARGFNEVILRTVPMSGSLFSYQGLAVIPFLLSYFQINVFNKMFSAQYMCRNMERAHAGSHAAVPPCATLDNLPTLASPGTSRLTTWLQTYDKYPKFTSSDILRLN